MIKIKGRKTLLLFYAAVFLLFFLLSAVTPMVSDDFAYSFSWTDWTRIRSVSQIIPSMQVHRITTNGRVLVHGLVQLLLMLPRPVFSLLNAGMTVLLLAFIRHLTVPETSGQNISVLLSSVLFLFCFTPAFGENFLWLDGALNYSWSMTVSLIFLSPYLSGYLGIPFNQSVPVSVIRFLIAFYFGTCSESGSLIFLCLALCFWILQWLRERKLPLFPLLWMLAALLGYVFLMTAPATAGRASDINISAVGYQFRLVMQAAEEHLLVPFLAFAVLMALVIFFRAERKVLIAVSLLFLGGLAALASYVLAVYFVPRHLYCTVFLTMLSCAMLLAELCRSAKTLPLCLSTACLCVLFLLRFPVGVLDVAISHHKQTLREQQIEAALSEGKTSVVLENYYPYTSYAIPFIMNETDPSVGPNINISDYYGLSAVLGVDPPSE